MKFKIEKTWFVKDQQERFKTKKIYTDFYCSLCEWATLEKAVLFLNTKREAMEIGRANNQISVLCWRTMGLAYC